MLGYHSHNNMQQAMGNASAFTEMHLHRDIILDACVFGMGRGAGNLNLELFAEYMNENFDKQYRIEPMLEIIDEYLNDITGSISGDIPCRCICLPPTAATRTMRSTSHPREH